ncbi:MAG: universal stress protein [Acidobacteriota bacterium]
MNQVNRPERLTASVETQPAPFQRILACTDFSATTDKILRFAGAVSKLCSAKLLILHVNASGAIPDTSGGTNEYVESLKRDVEDRFEEAVDSVRKMGVDAQGVMAEGDAGSVILRAIRNEGFDLAVVGTRGAMGLERFLFGSTAEMILRSAACPVMTVGPGIRRDLTIPDCGPVIFATDFHKPATAAAQCAIELAKLYGVPLDCVHVLPTTLNHDADGEVITEIMTRAFRQLIQKTEPSGVESSFHIAFGDEVSTAVLAYAIGQGAQAIVLGARRANPLANHLPHQIVHQIALGSPCPVITCLV